MDELTRYIAEHPYFAGLSAAELAQVCRMARVRHLGHGQVLALEGSPCEEVFLLLEGRVRALKTSPEGREQVVRELQPGEGFYLVPALDGGPLPVTTITATRVTLLSFSQEDFLFLLERYPTVARRVLVEFAGRLRRLAALTGELALRTVPQRLARLLLESARAGRRMTQREMAAQIGTVREVVARALTDFERRGWLRRRRGIIELVDVRALQRLGLGEEV
ncbi:MAG: Crp/Fnr family transcriptional regulator [Anaerolineae bacterium]|nr:Crp/Fnr family transcriptional regulator [Anaerolineae bacterium]